MLPFVSAMMPRSLRVVLPGVAVHVIQRGTNRMACFRGDGDYFLYLLHLKNLASGLDCQIHAYCLMTNHVHLLLTPPSARACTTLMRNLGQRYVQHFNRTYERTGGLWEGRFRSCVTQSARYVLACYRYIELNPVRAGMVDHPRSYPWSSYAANVDGREDALISPHPEYLALAPDAAARRVAYAGLFDQALELAVLTDIRGAINSGYVLGSEAFKSKLSALGVKIELGRPGRPSQTKSGSDPVPTPI